jgi:hypothetical protein
MDKQNTNGTNTSSPSPKRFRPDMASIRAKQTTPVNNKRISIPYRNNNNQYQRQLHHQYNTEQQQQQQQQTRSPSPTRDNLEDSIKQMINETKQITDMELNMNCSEEQLTEAQLAHCPVKVSTRKSIGMNLNLLFN